MSSATETAAAPVDPYARSREAIEAPPVSILAALRRIGPGIVLASSIVGSGEVIATTTLGAQVGFAALWIVLVSCAIKPVVQGELGRYVTWRGQRGNGQRGRQDRLPHLDASCAALNRPPPRRLRAARRRPATAR